MFNILVKSGILYYVGTILYIGIELYIGTEFYIGAYSPLNSYYIYFTYSKVGGFYTSPAAPPLLLLRVFQLYSVFTELLDLLIIK